MEREENGFQGGFRKSGRTCFHCGGNDIASAVQISQNAESGSIGLAYKVWKLLRGVEPLLADLCQSCGTVLRLYVKEAKKEWIRDKALARYEPQNLPTE
ncbi:MAG: hypothetical protein CXZ00_10985 [Acidobacteria bacterium]|nr:MAG: hypothetical protein CXZ00_10985 [Acidobacteriota bacterium]